jgi:tetratricopeptide (TPR) repeat protein
MLSTLEYFPEENLSFFESLLPVINNYIGQNPHRPDLYNVLGTLCVKTKRYGEGAEAFRAALNINPEYLEARFNLFKTFKAQGKLEAAVDEGKVLLEKKLPYPDFYCSLGEIYISMDKLDQADATLQRATLINPKRAETHFLLAKVHESRGLKEKAIAALKECVACNPPESLKQKAKEFLRKLTP